MCRKRKKLTVLISVLLVIVLVMSASQFRLSARRGEVRVLYPSGMRLYGLNTSITSEYNIVVNITSNMTLRGTWSSFWHILPEMGLNALYQGNITSITNVTQIANRTGPEMVFWLSRPPPPSSLPTNGSFSIMITLHNRSSFRMSGWYTSLDNGTVSLNESVLLPVIALKYGLLLSFVFVRPAENVQPPPYLTITQDFETVS